MGFGLEGDGAFFDGEFVFGQEGFRVGIGGVVLDLLVPIDFFAVDAMDDFFSVDF